MQQNTDYRKKIFSATFLVIIATLLSKISGLARDQIMAGYFGISYQTDAFTWAYFIPNLFRVLFAESIIIAAFIPVYTSYLKKGEAGEIDDFVSSVTNIFILIFMVISVLVFIFSSPIGILLSKISGNNMDISSFSLMNRIMIFSLVVMSISGLITSILNSHNKFTVPAIAPLVMNVISIIFVVLLAKNIGIVSMAIGVMIGSILEVIIQIPGLKSADLKYKFRIDFKNKAVREIFGMMVPIMLSLGAVQINNSVDNFFALNLGAGNTTALTFSWRVANLPLGVFSVAVITVLYPLISRQAADGNMKGLKESFSLGFREIGYIMVPASLGMIILSNPIIKILFERYQFTAADTAKVSNILIFHSTGLLFFGLLMILNRIFYSLKNVRTPLKVALASIGINFILDWVLIKFLDVSGVALSTSIVGVINVIVLLIILRKKIGYLSGRKIILSYAKITGASAVMCVVVYYLWKFLSVYFSSGTFMLLLLLIIIIVIGSGVYVLLTYLFKMEEVRFVAGALKNRFIK
ncbi:murein biosynthesis integral membrane protein MurJ [bacterium]|nr:murein biosynthesis integral membrane protein MurJ [bacterium]